MLQQTIVLDCRHLRERQCRLLLLPQLDRQQLVVEETAHLAAVLAHPAFVADPFAALQVRAGSCTSQPAQSSHDLVVLAGAFAKHGGPSS